MRVWLTLLGEENVRRMPRFNIYMVPVNCGSSG